MDRRRKDARRLRRPQSLDPFVPHLFRLEDRRVLDVSAAFSTASGQLDLVLTNPVESATISVEGGNLSIRDSQQQQVAIDVDGGGSAPVNASIVDSIHVAGDAAGGQAVVVASPLALPDGFVVEGSVERTQVQANLFRMDQGSVRIDSSETELGADIETTGQRISFAGSVRLTADVHLTGLDVTFASPLDDDGATATGSRLFIDAGGVTRFAGPIGSLSPVQHLETDAAGRTELNDSIAAAGNSIQFHDPVTLTSDVSISDTGTSGIFFGSTIDSQEGGHFSLTLAAPASQIQFNGSIGAGANGDQRLGSLTVESAADGVLFGELGTVPDIHVAGPIDIGVGTEVIGGAGIVLRGDAAGLSLTAEGSLRFNGPTILGSDVLVLVDGGSIRFTADAPVDSEANQVHSLALDAGTGAVFFNADLGAAGAIRGLSVTRAESGIRFGEADSKQANGTGPVGMLHSVDAVTLGTSGNAVAGGIQFNAGPGQTFRLTTTNDPVVVNGPVTLASSLEIDTSSGPGDIQFFAGRIDSESGEANALDLHAGTGSVSFSHDIGSLNALGALVVAGAGGGVRFGTADAAASGLGPVTQLIAQGRIDIGTGTNSIAGSGIVLNGGASGLLTVTSQTDDIRWNGPVILDTDVHLIAGGDITFTNDAPVDSRQGEMHALRIDASAGTVSFNEDVGGNAILESVTITAARDGVLFGGAANEVPGAGGSGPVEVIRLDGPFEVGSVDAVGGVGIVLSGSAVAPQRISTEHGEVRMHGAVTLQTDVEIQADANLFFSRAATIDSGPSRAASLTLDAGSGRIDFNNDLGSSRLLGSFVVTRAAGGVVFGSADVASPGPLGTGPVSLIRTDQTIDIVTGTNEITGAGIVFNGGSATLTLSTTGDDIRLNGPVHLASRVSIQTGAGAGDIVFTSSATIDSQDGPGAATNLERNQLLLDAGRGRVTFNANVGETQALGSLVIDRAGGGVTIGGSDSVVPGGAGPVTHVRTEGTIDVGSGSDPDDVLGPVVLNGGAARLVVETNGADMRVNGPTALQSDVTLSTGPGAGDIQFTAPATIDGQDGESPTLELVAGGGRIRFAASIGGLSRLGEVIVRSVSELDVAGALHVARVVQESGSAHTIFHDQVSTDHASLPGLELSGSAITFNGPVRATGDGRIVIDHSDLLDVNPGAEFRLDGAFVESGGGTVDWAANLATSGDPIEFNGPLTITDGPSNPTLFSTVAGGHDAGADLRFHSAVDGEIAGLDPILMNAGTGGDIEFLSAAGVGTPLGTLTIVQAEDARFQQLVATRVVQLNGGGTTTFTGAVALNHATLAALDLHTAAVHFQQTLTTTGHGGVTLNLDDSLVLDAAANMTLSGPFRQLGLASVEAGADMTTSSDEILFHGPVHLSDHIRLDTGIGAGSIRFAVSVDNLGTSPRDLTLRADAGDIDFAGPVGATTALGRLQVESARNVVFAEDVRLGSLRQVAGTGTTTIAATVETTSSDGMRLETRQIDITGVIDARGVGTADAGPVTLLATDDLRIFGQILGDAAPVVLSAGRDVRLGGEALIQVAAGSVAITADSDLAGDGAIAMQDGSLIDAGPATLTLLAQDDITIGRLVSAVPITVTSRGGAILDGGDSNAADLVAPAAELKAARGIGTESAGTGKDTVPENPLETEVALLAAANTQAGGILVSNQLAGELVVGSVNGLTGLTNGGAGRIEITHTRSLRIEQPVLNQGGGETRLRAGFPGDLVAVAPIQNTGGDGSILLFAGGNLVIRDSLPEPPGLAENPPNPEQFFEIMVSGEGAVRGEASREILVDDGDANFVIIHTQTGQATNVPPILTVETVDQGGSDIDEQGRGILKITLGDDVHLETNHHIQITWGDGEIENYPIPGTINPLREPGNTDPRFVSGELDAMGSREPGVYFFSHRYFQHPNPNDPSRPIPIRVELRYDARPSGFLVGDDGAAGDSSAVFNGISFINQAGREVFSSQDDAFTVPGTGNFAFIKVVESVIVPVESRPVVLSPPVQEAAQLATSVGLRGDFRVERFDLVAREEYRLFMTVVDDVTGQESPERIDLDLELLSDPLALFRQRVFPNGHYRVYLEEIRTRRVRLILDVHIFNGKVVPPNFREGAAERQPDVEQPVAPQAPPAGNQNGAFRQGDPDQPPVARASRMSEWENQAILAGPPRSLTRVARLLRGVSNVASP